MKVQLQTPAPNKKRKRKKIKSRANRTDNYCSSKQIINSSREKPGTTCVSRVINNTGKGRWPRRVPAQEKKFNGTVRKEI